MKGTEQMVFMENNQGGTAGEPVPGWSVSVRNSEGFLGTPQGVPFFRWTAGTCQANKKGRQSNENHEAVDGFCRQKKAHGVFRVLVLTLSCLDNLCLISSFL